MSNNAKLVRGQVRQIVKEMLAEVLQAELTSAVRKELAEQLASRLNFIGAQLQEKLNEIDARSKDISAYLIRSSSAPAQPIQSDISPPGFALPVDMP